MGVDELLSEGGLEPAPVGKSTPAPARENEVCYLNKTHGALTEESAGIDTNENDAASRFVTP